MLRGFVRWRRGTYPSRWVMSYTHMLAETAWSEPRAKLRWPEWRVTVPPCHPIAPPPSDMASALSHEPTRLLSRPAIHPVPEVSNWLYSRRLPVCCVLSALTTMQANKHSYITLWVAIIVWQCNPSIHNIGSILFILFACAQKTLRHFHVLSSLLV